MEQGKTTGNEALSRLIDAGLSLDSFSKKVDFGWGRGVEEAGKFLIVLVSNVS